MSRKAVSILFLTILSLHAVSGPLFAWAPFHRTLPVEGRVTDAMTGKPIGNVVVSARWSKTMPALVDKMTKTMAVYNCVTDDTGKFSIPSRITSHFPPLIIMGSMFHSMTVSAGHPLYVCRQSLVYSKGTHWQNGARTEIMRGWSYIIDDGIGSKSGPAEIKDGVAQFDIQLIPLEEMYKTSKDTIALDTFFGGYHGYFITLKSKKILFDLDNIFSQWDRIADRFPLDIHHRQLQNTLNNSKKRIRAELDEANKRE